MSVIPLTLTISLCLVFTFVIFFLREHGRHRFSSAESDALLPLADETPRPVLAKRPGPAGNSAACGCERGEQTPCHGCRHRAGTEAES